MLSQKTDGDKHADDTLGQSSPQNLHGNPLSAEHTEQWMYHHQMTNKGEKNHMTYSIDRERKHLKISILFVV